MQLETYQWIVLGVGAVLLFLPGKLDVSGLAAKVRGWFARSEVASSPVAPASVDEQHAKYQAFLDVRTAVSHDASATDALDRIVLPTLVSGSSDKRYSVTWDGREVKQ